MRKRFARHAAGAIVLAAGTVALSGGSASADQLPTVYNQKCNGTQVVTCVYPVFPSDGGYYARAAITDTANDGHAYKVRVTDLKLYRAVDGNWAWIDHTEDYDGFHDNYDVVNGGYFSACDHGHWYRVEAKFGWEKANGEIDWHWQSYDTTGPAWCYNR